MLKLGEQVTLDRNGLARRTLISDVTKGHVCGTLVTIGVGRLVDVLTGGGTRITVVTAPETMDGFCDDLMQLLDDGLAYLQDAADRGDLAGADALQIATEQMHLAITAYRRAVHTQTMDSKS